MNEEEEKLKVLNKLQEGFYTDKSKTVIYPFTQLNLVQIARRRVGKAIYDYIDEPCRECNGNGRRIKLSYVNFLIKNELKNIKNNIKHVYIEISKIYEEEIKGDILGFIKTINALDKNIYLNFVNEENYFKVEPLIFMNQIENLQMYKVYG